MELRNACLVTVSLSAAHTCSSASTSGVFRVSNLQDIHCCSNNITRYNQMKKVFCGISIILHYNITMNQILQLKQCMVHCFSWRIWSLELKQKRCFQITCMWTNDIHVNECKCITNLTLCICDQACKKGFIIFSDLLLATQLYSSSLQWWALCHCILYSSCVSDIFIVLCTPLTRQLVNWSSPKSIRIYFISSMTTSSLVDAMWWTFSLRIEGTYHWWCKRISNISLMISS